MIETKKPPTRNSHTRRNIAIIVTVIVIAIVALAYYTYENIREKEEVLSPQQRWIILDANYDREHTSITFKYLGENRIIARFSTISYGHKGPIFQDILFESGDLGTVRKGHIETVEIQGYTYRLTITFGRYGASGNRAELDVLPEEDFEG